MATSKMMKKSEEPRCTDGRRGTPCDDYVHWTAESSAIPCRAAHPREIGIGMDPQENGSGFKIIYIPR